MSLLCEFVFANLFCEIVFFVSLFYTFVLVRLVLRVCVLSLCFEFVFWVCFVSLFRQFVS